MIPPVTIADALERAQNPSHVTSLACQGVVRATGWSLDQVHIALDYAEQNKDSTQDSVRLQVGRMAMAANLAWTVAQVNVLAFIRWLNAENMPAVTSEWHVASSGTPCLTALFLQGQWDYVEHALRLLCPLDPMLHVGRELPIGWSHLGDDAIVTQSRIIVTQPWRDTGWTRLHPCTQSIANAIAIQNNWTTAGDLRGFLERVRFQLQSPAVPVRS